MALRYEGASSAALLNRGQWAFGHPVTSDSGSEKDQRAGDGVQRQLLSVPGSSFERSPFVPVRPDGSFGPVLKDVRCSRHPRPVQDVLRVRDYLAGLIRRKAEERFQQVFEPPHERSHVQAAGRLHALAAWVEGLPGDGAERQVLESLAPVYVTA